jgi:hypothetical protein
MSLLYLHFETPERDARLQKLTKSGAHVVVTEPRWPGFHEVAKKEKPYAIAIDFSLAPSHSLETADYLAKAKETRETPLYVLRVPDDRLDMVRKRLPQALFVTEPELSEKLAELEREAEEKAREKKRAAAEARKLARARNAKNAAVPAGKLAAAPAPAKAAAKKKPAPAAKIAPKKKSSLPPRPKKAASNKKRASRPPKKR